MFVSIRKGEIRDAAVIADFNCRMALETEHKRLDPAIALRGVSRVFDDAGKGFYLVAERGGQIVGQLMITFEWSDWRDGWIWWIQSVYVHESHRRGGVFRSLHEAIVEKAKAAGDVVAIRLYVERDNSRAHATYEKLGLRDANYLVREMMLESA